jgi:hypothetical protein
MIFDIGPILQALADIIMIAKTTVDRSGRRVEFDQFAKGRDHRQGDR